MLEKLEYNKIPPKIKIKNNNELKDITHFSGNENYELAKNILMLNFSLYNNKLSSFFTNFLNSNGDEKRKKKI